MVLAVFDIVFHKMGEGRTAVDKIEKWSQPKVLR